MVLFCKHVQGTTWVMEIVRNIIFLRDKDLMDKTKHLEMFYQFIEFGPGKPQT